MNKVKLSIMRGAYLIICSLVFVLIIKLFKGYGDYVRFIIYFLTAAIIIAGYPFFTFGVFLRAYSKQVDIAFKDAYNIVKYTPTNIVLPNFLIKCSILSMVIAVGYSVFLIMAPNNTLALLVMVGGLAMAENFFSRAFDNWVKDLSESDNIGILEYYRGKIIDYFSYKMSENAFRLFLIFDEKLPKYLRKKYPNINDNLLIAGISALAGSCYQVFEVNIGSFSTITASNGDKLYDYDNPIEVFPMMLNRNLTIFKNFQSEELNKIVSDETTKLLSISQRVKNSIGTKLFGVASIFSGINPQPHPLQISKDNLEYCRVLAENDFTEISQALIACAYLVNYDNTLMANPSLTHGDFEQLVLESAISASKIDFEQLKNKQF